MEFENTVASLDRHLPESGRVLDAVSAAGRYSMWLAERGHDVTLVDLSPKQVELAREKAAERGLDADIAAETGDVRDL